MIQKVISHLKIIAGQKIKNLILTIVFLNYLSNTVVIMCLDKVEESLQGCGGLISNLSFSLDVSLS